MMNVKISEDFEKEITTEQLKDLKIDAVLEKMWKFNQTYKISTEQLVNITE